MLTWNEEHTWLIKAVKMKTKSNKNAVRCELQTVVLVSVSK